MTPGRPGPQVASLKLQRTRAAGDASELRSALVAAERAAAAAAAGSEYEAAVGAWEAGTSGGAAAAAAGDVRTSVKIVLLTGFESFK